MQYISAPSGDSFVSGEFCRLVELLPRLENSGKSCRSQKILPFSEMLRCWEIPSPVQISVDPVTTGKFCPTECMSIAGLKFSCFFRSKSCFCVDNQLLELKFCLSRELYRFQVSLWLSEKNSSSTGESLLPMENDVAPKKFIGNRKSAALRKIFSSQKILSLTRSRESTSEVRRSH